MFRFPSSIPTQILEIVWVSTFSGTSRLRSPRVSLGKFQAVRYMGISAVFWGSQANLESEKWKPALVLKQIKSCVV